MLWFPPSWDSSLGKTRRTQKMLPAIPYVECMERKCEHEGLGLASAKARAQCLGIKQAWVGGCSLPVVKWAPNPCMLTGQETGTCLGLDVAVYEMCGPERDLRLTGTQDSSPVCCHGASNPKKEDRWNGNILFMGPMNFSRKSNIGTYTFLWDQKKKDQKE